MPRQEATDGAGGAEAQRTIDVLRVSDCPHAKAVQVRPDATLAQAVWTMVHAVRNVDWPMLRDMLVYNARLSLLSTFPGILPPGALVLTATTDDTLRSRCRARLDDAFRVDGGRTPTEVSLGATLCAVSPLQNNLCYLPITEGSLAQYVGQVVGATAAVVLLQSPEFTAVARDARAAAEAAGTMCWCDDSKITRLLYTAGAVVLGLGLLVVFLAWRLWRRRPASARRWGDDEAR